MSIKSRTAKRHVFNTIPDTPDRQVPTRHDKFELTRSRLPEDRDRMFFAVTTRIVLQLFFDPIVPVG